MSTRSILRDRRRFFIHTLRKDPENKNLLKTVDELNFIIESLKEYDKRQAGNTEGDS